MWYCQCVLYVPCTLMLRTDANDGAVLLVKLLDFPHVLEFVGV
jgi:hypothetical protein